jgi:micrococcal nuclease
MAVVLGAGTVCGGTALLGCADDAVEAAGSVRTQSWSSETDEPELEEATVERVVDGDTIIVRVDGERERVRLIGINTPESVAPEAERNTEEGVEASDYTKSLVGEGDTVWLESDVSDRDKYDRLLRYVWLEKPTDTDDPAQIKKWMLNAIIVDAGYGEARAYEPDTAHQDVLDSLNR